MFSAYLREKGRRYAAHEDLQKILEELRQTTRTAEDIKAEISGGLWFRQQQWNYKRDIYERLLSCLADQKRLIGMMQAQRLLHDAKDPARVAGLWVLSSALRKP